MFPLKSKKLKISTKKSILDHILFFIENYLPQKTNKIKKKELSLDNLELKNIYQIQKLVSVRSKSLIPEQKNIKVSLIFGKWALPYLKLIKTIGLIN